MYDIYIYGETNGEIVRFLIEDLFWVGLSLGCTESSASEREIQVHM